ncbi:MAG: hypothetical protein OEZ06_29975 [Myxococcales bacterium]|nr:hypothetical protein [Myxococcales bacterium]
MFVEPTAWLYGAVGRACTGLIGAKQQGHQHGDGRASQVEVGQLRQGLGHPVGDRQQRLEHLLAGSKGTRLSSEPGAGPGSRTAVHSLCATA